MEKRAYQQIMLFLFCFILVLFQSSCGIISVMSSPTRYEEEIPAEFRLADLEAQKILVLVEQPYWLDAKVNLRVHLTNAIHQQLTGKVKILPESLIAYDKLSRYRASRSDFSLLKPSQVGKALDADVVLFVNVNEAQLESMPDSDIYKGLLSARVFLIDTATGVNLWPEQSSGRRIRVGFDIEDRGLRMAVSRLSTSTAHCIVRYLYDCKVAYFKIRDDKSDPAWEYWE
jgi:hypothetical protein